MCAVHRGNSGCGDYEMEDEMSELLPCPFCGNGIIKQHFILSVEEVASIIHKGIYEKDISEEFPVRNLHIYAIAKMICDKQMGGANEIPKM